MERKMTIIKKITNFVAKVFGKKEQTIKESHVSLQANDIEVDKTVPNFDYYNPVKSEEPFDWSSTFGMTS